MPQLSVAFPTLPLGFSPAHFAAFPSYSYSFFFSQFPAEPASSSRAETKESQRQRPARTLLSFSSWRFYSQFFCTPFFFCCTPHCPGIFFFFFFFVFCCLSVLGPVRSQIIGPMPLWRLNFIEWQLQLAVGSLLAESFQLSSKLA